MSFLKKLAKKGVNKLKARAIDKVTDAIFGGLGRNKGRTFGFGGSSSIPTRSSQNGTFDYRSHFHQQLAGHGMHPFQTPNRSLWFVVIDPFPQALNMEAMHLLECGGMAVVNERGPTKEKHYPAHDGVVDALTRTELQNQQGGKDQNAGCLFAQGVNLPTEQMSTQRVSVDNNRGFVPGLVAGNRNEFNPLSIEFRETTISFVDTIIRPWVTLASHYGFVARAKDDPKNIKSDITVYQLGIDGHTDGPYIRKQTTFHNCVPFQIAQQQYTYDTDSGAMNPIDVQWAYTNYSIRTSKPGSGTIVNDSKGLLDVPDGFGNFDGPSAADLTASQFNTGAGGMGFGGGMPGLKL